MVDPLPSFVIASDTIDLVLQKFDVAILNRQVERKRRPYVIQSFQSVILKGRDFVSMRSDGRADDIIMIACKQEDLDEPPRIGKDLRMPNA